ncbi:MAG: DUF523 domain-containing protein [Deltaproteobacteria bacterium]|nr:DUF523 domain-containing protein [Deltaproteobacteria bacterium]
MTARLSGADPLPDVGDVTAENPLVVVVSACLLGQEVAYDGSAFPSDPVQAICALPNVSAHSLCPEAVQLGTPRRWMSIHHGDGYGVLDATAKVVNVDGRDISDAFRLGAMNMLQLARRHGAVLAILTDISPSCGSTVVYDGSATEQPAYQASSGVTAALLRRHGIPVISQRDFATLSRLRAALDPTHEVDAAARDHVDGEWYQQTFVHPVPEGPEPTFEEA